MWLARHTRPLIGQPDLYLYQTWPIRGLQLIQFKAWSSHWPQKFQLFKVQLDFCFALVVWSLWTGQVLNGESLAFHPEQFNTRPQLGSDNRIKDSSLKRPWLCHLIMMSIITSPKFFFTLLCWFSVDILIKPFIFRQALFQSLFLNHS